VGAAASAEEAFQGPHNVRDRAPKSTGSQVRFHGVPKTLAETAEQIAEGKEERMRFTMDLSPVRVLDVLLTYNFERRRNRQAFKGSR
jgi:hypothetical protein